MLHVENLLNLITSQAVFCLLNLLKDLQPHGTQRFRYALRSVDACINAIMWSVVRLVEEGKKIVCHFVNTAQ